MVDCESQVIVAQDVVAEAADGGQLGPMLDQCEAGTGGHPDQLLGDAGYWSEANAELEDDRTELFISTTKDWKRRKELREQGPARGRIPDHYGPKKLMERKLRTKRGRRIYKERSTSVEPVFGQMVNRGLGSFLLRGKTGARAEWSLLGHAQPAQALPGRLEPRGRRDRGRVGARSRECRAGERRPPVQPAITIESRQS